MARTRSIKPEFWSDEKIGNLSMIERLLFIGLWTFSDDEGLCRANPLYLKSMIFPYDQIEENELKNAIQKLDKNGFIYTYKSSNQSYLWIIKFRVYQRIDKPQKPTNPAPSVKNLNYAKAIFKRDNYRCHICNSQCSECQIIGEAVNPRVASLDHIIPVSKNGSDYPTNLKTSCISCNKSRGNRDIESFQKDNPIIFQEHSTNIPRTFNAETETEEKLRETEKENTSPAGSLNANGDGFEQFWKAYPKKRAKADCLEIWKKLKRKKIIPDIEKIIDSIESQKQERENLKTRGAFCPEWKDPERWLKKGCWDDEPQEQRSNDDCPGFDWSKP